MEDDCCGRRLALSEFVRQTFYDFYSIRPGEEEGFFNEALVGLAKVMSLTLAGRWDISRHSNQPQRRFRWVRDGAELTDPPTSAISRDHPMAQLATSIEQATVLDDHDLDPQTVSASPLAQRITRIMVPGSAADMTNSILILGRPRELPWLDWEKEMVTDFARLIPQVRSRVDIEARIAASFENAPIGITLRNEDGDLLECNPAFLQFLGYDSADDLPGDAGLDLVAQHVIEEELLEAIVAAQRLDGRSRLQLPFNHKSGNIVWGRVAQSRIRTHFGHRWIAYVEDITELHAQHELTRERATKDPLTGLANRHALHDQLEHLLTVAPNEDGRAPCALAMLDLDGFKAINDTFGHAAGDHVLITIGQRINNLVRYSDLVARLGGDEFVVLFAGPITEKDAEALAVKVKKAVAQPIDFDGIELRVGASVGTAVGVPEQHAGDIIAVADANMYLDKADDLVMI